VWQAALSEPEKFGRHGVAACRVTRDDQDGVVAGHGAEDRRQRRVIDDRGEELRRPGRCPEYHQVGAGFGRGHQLGQVPR
jgi:hypothetical protein